MGCQSAAIVRGGDLQVAFTMSRPMALGLVLLVLILTSQSDWKQDTNTPLEETASPVTKREMALTNLELVRRKIVLIQEKEIYELRQQVKFLEDQLRKCQGVSGNSTREVTALMDDWPDQETQESEPTQEVHLTTEELVEPVEAVPVDKTARLRGNVRTSSRGKEDISERPSELPAATGESFETVEEEDKTGNW